MNHNNNNNTRQIVEESDEASHSDAPSNTPEAPEFTDLDGSEMSFNWVSRVRLVELVSVHGKNWGALLKKLHDEHLISSITDTDKLRTQFNSLNSPKSAFRQPFKRRTFKCPKKDPKTKKKITVGQQITLEDEHDAAENIRRSEHKKTQDLLNKIADEELKAMKGRGQKRSISEVNAVVDAAEEERKIAKNDRTEGARKLARRQEKQQQLFVALLQKSVNVLETTKVGHRHPPDTTSRIRSATKPKQFS